MVDFSKEFLRRVFIRDRLIFVSGIAALILDFITWGSLLWRGLPLRARGFLPLHYNIYFGVDLVGPWYGIFAGAAFGFIALVVNALVIGMIYERDRLMSHLFAVGTVFIELILLLASIFIILLNI